MTVIGYICGSSDKQDLQKQEHLLLKYAQQHGLHIDEFIKAEISSRKDAKRQIHTIINPQPEKPITYNSYQSFVRPDPELLELWQAQKRI